MAKVGLKELRKGYGVRMVFDLVCILCVCAVFKSTQETLHLHTRYSRVYTLIKTYHHDYL